MLPYRNAREHNARERHEFAHSRHPKKPCWPSIIGGVIYFCVLTGAAAAVLLLLLAVLRRVAVVVLVVGSRERLAKGGVFCFNFISCGWVYDVSVFLTWWWCELDAAAAEPA